MSGLDFLAPRGAFPLLPMRHGVLFPGTVITVPMGREKSMALLATLKPGDIIGLGVQSDPGAQDPAAADLLAMGTFGRVRNIARSGPRQARLTLEGLDRFRLDRLVETTPFLLAEGHVAEEIAPTGELAERLTAGLVKSLRALGDLPDALTKLLDAPDRAHNPGLFCDRIAAALGLSSDKEAELLMTLDVQARLEQLQKLVEQAHTLADVRATIDERVRKELGKHQREAILREQLRAIQKELGEGDEGDDELGALRTKLDDAGLPEDVRKVADKELARLGSAQSQSPERGVIRSYLELIASLPWSKRAPADVDLAKVAAKLDDDHFGLDEVKKRILEHLAVLKATGNAKATILCLAGPPGVGKTSLGQSIADALTRPFVRVALGGVRDEAEIRGHRRTYVGALPGRILNALKTAGAKNPVFLLDEIDKLGQWWGGSPEAALLEVLDPEQNKTFQDHYLELPFDLSEVLFICTANTLETLSPPLRDRLEIIELSGYTTHEKIEIAKRHLLPKKLAEHGLLPEQLAVTDRALAAITAGYTREAGVRQLSRELQKLCRAVVLEVMRHPETKAAAKVIDDVDLAAHLGKLRFFSEVAERTQVPGVATGLAWTPVGGDILFIETSRMPGKGRLEITGQLGDVMKESARAALSYVRSHAEELGVAPEFLEKQDLHIHVPAGGVPKDGPSAGVTMFTAMTSLLTGQRVRSDTAMTGECTLRGRVLPVGGIKEKVLAAHRAGLLRVILPKKNQRDLDDVPDEARSQIEFIFAEDMSQVLEAALEPLAPALGSGMGPSGPTLHS
jgi:ATP-dependent Lon protease